MVTPRTSDSELTRDMHFSSKLALIKKINFEYFTHFTEACHFRHLRKDRSVEWIRLTYYFLVQKSQVITRSGRGCRTMHDSWNPCSLGTWYDDNDINKPTSSYSPLSISRGVFSTNISQKTPHSPSVRARYRTSTVVSYSEQSYSIYYRLMFNTELSSILVYREYMVFNLWLTQIKNWSA